ncbi:uncharacterized protein MEPE_01344 [Melanopsichium pennsylvanicum]|uniref:Uncharacterized protein n=1 Tax=Melanopsichium pennsylvanicum TaxID=63383 RepID=A0AAJ4XIA6_9BASI|nr:uncharacterized protein MEPE_01344 [Melanopsichium pennsylvanicum]
MVSFAEPIKGRMRVGNLERWRVVAVNRKFELGLASRSMSKARCSVACNTSNSSIGFHPFPSLASTPKALRNDAHFGGCRSARSFQPLVQQLKVTPMIQVMRAAAAVIPTENACGGRTSPLRRLLGNASGRATKPNDLNSNHPS